MTTRITKVGTEEDFVEVYTDDPQDEEPTIHLFIHATNPAIVAIVLLVIILLLGLCLAPSLGIHLF